MPVTTGKRDCPSARSAFRGDKDPHLVHGSHQALVSDKFMSRHQRFLQGSKVREWANGVDATTAGQQFED